MQSSPLTSPLSLSVLVVALLVSVTFYGRVDARVSSLDLKTDNRNLVQVMSFGYEFDGRFELDIRHFSLQVPFTQKDEAKARSDFRIAMVLERSMSEEDYSGECFHEVKAKQFESGEAEGMVFSLASYEDWSPHKIEEVIKKPGDYHLYISFCEPTYYYNIELELTEYNMNAHNERNYLSAGESLLPTVYFFICGFFVVEAVIWLNHMRRFRAEIKSIHYLMTAVLFLKMGTLFFQVFEFHSLKITGQPHGWNVLYYIFSFVKGMMLFAVIVLIGTGWSYLKPFLTERDKQIMLAVLVVQLLSNVASVVMDETAPGAREWLTWRDMLHLLDMICCCAILLPIVWSIRHLREASDADGKAARNAERLNRFRTFYLLVVAYIYFTRIIIYLIEATLSFELTWLGPAFAELAALAFYGVTGYLFRPQPNNPYLSIDDNNAPDTV
jgi:G protein-coupled receptor 107